MSRAITQVLVNYVTSFHDFCRDSAKQASLMALTAPKILNSQFSIFLTFAAWKEHLLF